MRSIAIVVLLSGMALGQALAQGALIPPASYPVVDAPFSAVIEVKRVEILPDKTRAHHQFTTRFVRDGAGRQRVETGGDTWKDSSSAPDVLIYDVVAQTSIHLNTANATAKIVAMPVRHEAVRVPASQPGSSAADPRPPESEDRRYLKPKKIAGLTAVGTLTTRIIPAGTEGNAKDIKITDELWVSPDYRMPLMRIEDDPRHGHLEIKVTRFTAGEPNAKLFEIPQGYSIETEGPKRLN